MPEKKFIVELAADENHEWALAPSEVYSRLSGVLGFSDVFWITEVKPYVKPGIPFPGKIAAIKYLRTLINPMSLVEAKDVIDAATHLGRFRYPGGLLIEYNPKTGNYTITDGR